MRPGVLLCARGGRGRVIDCRQGDARVTLIADGLAKRESIEMRQTVSTLESSARIGEYVQHLPLRERQQLRR